MEINNNSYILSTKNISSANISKKQDLKNNASAEKINFTGFPNCFKPYLKQTVKFDAKTNDFLYHMSGILGVSEETMQKKVQAKTQAHLKLLNSMVNKFNGDNFGKAASQKDDASIVLDIFERITAPQEEHIGFVNRSKLKMADVYKCFNMCEDDPKKLSKLEDMYIKLNKTHKQDDYMKQIIDSPNVNEYIENIDTYLPHLSASTDSKGLIAKIDKELAKKSSDFIKLYDNVYVERVLHEYPQTSTFTKDKLLNNYTKEGANLLYIMSPKFGITKETMQAGDAKGFFRIYSTTTKENYKFRRDFINANYHNFGQRDRMGNNEINDLAVVLEYADKNPAAKKFLEGLSRGNRGLGSAAGYIELFDKIGAQRLSEDTKPILNIIQNDFYTPTQTVFDYYKTVAAKPKTLFTVILNKIEKRTEITPSEVSLRELMKGDAMNRAIDKTSSEPTIQSIIKSPMVKPIDDLRSNIIKDIQEEKHSYFKPFVPKAPNAKKLVVINNVDAFIKNKLGSKVYDEQKAIYANNTTKMRAGMLDKIFSSIKDTRAAERDKGTFSKHKSISNEAAVDLYRRINGKNKKLVNYMLKKRNADGTRTFSVNDILDTLADANRSILEGKKQSTKLNCFSAKDERAIYDSILNEKIAQNGKLQRTKRN